MRSTVAGALAGVLALTIATAAGAQSKLPATTKIVPGSAASGFAPTAYAEPTADFENDVRELDAVQMQMAQVAEQKASPSVKTFAKRVHLEFAGGQAGLKGKSDDEGVPLVGGGKLKREHQTLLTQLKANNANVDRLFVDYEVLVLREHLGLVESYATGGVEARLRQASAQAASADRVLLGVGQSLQH